MHLQKREHPKVKPGLHPRNKHSERYDFEALVKSVPELEPFVRLNPYQDLSIDFFDPEAVKMLNKALLVYFYGIEYWDIPRGYLCPPIPGRADYLHYMADLLAAYNHGKIPLGSQVRCLDVGVGANCIYPIIGYSTYGWSFVGSEIDPVAVGNASGIIRKNPAMEKFIELRLQKNKTDIFSGIIQPGEHFDLTICNPPFHRSAQEAMEGSQRKTSHLKGKKISKPILNFGGQNSELWCDGGEEQFVLQMISQSRQWAASSGWFSALISKSEHLATIYKALKVAMATEIKTIPMAQGNKTSRIVAWNFHDPFTDFKVK
jgi:23S rRNA (adenine1618-N6)-methyltransferase